MSESTPDAEEKRSTEMISISINGYIEKDTEEDDQSTKKEEEEEEDLDLSSCDSVEDVNDVAAGYDAEPSKKKGLIRKHSSRVVRRPTMMREWEYCLVFQDPESDRLCKAAKKKDDEEKAEVAALRRRGSMRRRGSSSFRSSESAETDEAKSAKDETDDTDAFYRVRKINFEVIVRMMTEADIDLVLERHGDYVYCKIRLHSSTLRAHADKNDIIVPLVGKEVRKIAEKGIPEKNILPFPIRNDEEVCDVDPFSFLYAQYDGSRELEKLYGAFSPLVCSQISLSVLHTIARNFGNRLDSTNFTTDMQDLIRDQTVPLVAYFPLHNPDESKSFEKAWLSWTTKPWDIPVDGIRSYFGEKIGFYYVRPFSSWQLDTIIFAMN